jgi:hypothetical protein
MQLSFASFARLPKSSRAFLSLGLAVLAFCPAIAQLPPRPVIDPAEELSAIKAASTLDDDPQDAEAVRDVCTACHSASQYLTTPRSSSRWEQVYGQMARNGVNTSPLEELGPTLQTNDEFTTAIVMRRAQKPFTGIADLAGIPGVRRDVLVKLKDRLQF